MAHSVDEPLLDRFAWSELTERSWDEVAIGIPQQLVALTHDLSRRNRRPIRLYTMPMIEAGVPGVALPFIEEDGIAFDPSLLGRPVQLSRVLAEELALMLYPGWPGLGDDELDRMAEFGAIVAETILGRLPRTVDEIGPVIDTVMCSLESDRPAYRQPEAAIDGR